MKSFNIINTEEIEVYLRKFCEGDTHLEMLLIATMANILKKSPESIEEITELPKGAPSWLVDKWDTRSLWQKFNYKKDVRLSGYVGTIVVPWLQECVEHDVEWLKNVDEQGRPKKLLQISSDLQLRSSIVKDQERRFEVLRQTAGNQFENNEDSNDMKPVMAFENGYSIVRLKTRRALDLEGAYLEHCIGDDHDNALNMDTEGLYSLRDERNLPCVTLYVTQDDKGYSYLISASGKRNSWPKGVYIPYIAAFCHHKEIGMREAFYCNLSYEFFEED